MHLTSRFSGKTALITGGTSGIGLATAKAFIAEGANVIVTSRSNAALDKARVELGANSSGFIRDAASLADAREFAATLTKSNTRLDAVFVNAGIAEFRPFSEVDELLWDRTFATNVKGAYFLLQALLPLLSRSASIVLNGSINAHLGMPNSSVYAASKAALISLAKTLSAELLPQGVRVNVISPGPIQTPLYGKLGLGGEQLQQVAAQI